MYLIIVGAGDVGRPLVEFATNGGNEVVVVEADERRANGVAEEFDCLAVHDDATVKETLVEAGARRADAVVSTTNSDATNVMVCLLAQELDVDGVVSVVHDPDHRDLFSQIGVNTMEHPQRLIAEHLYRAVERPSIVDFMRISDRAEIFEIVVTDDAPIAGKSLIDADAAGLFSDELLIVAIERPSLDGPLIPHGETRIEEGDVLTVYSSVGATPDVTDVFGHYEDHSTSPASRR